MRKSALLFIAVFCLSLFSFAQQSRKDRIIASYMIAFGRPPVDAEVNYWMTDALSNQNLSVLVEKHRNNMNKVDRTLRTAAVKQSYIDAFGRSPQNEELNYWMSQSNTYAELVTQHIKFLIERPAEWQKVIIASYQMAFKKNPESSELIYWKGQSPRSFLSMIVQHDNFLKEYPHLRPKSGNTAGKPIMKKENTVPISNTILAEIRNSGSSCISVGGGNVIATGGGNVIATGGGNVISTGGGN